VIEMIRRAERPLTVEDFLNAPIPDRPVEDRLPKDWQQRKGGQS
jgi:hypothetical protein